MGTEKSGRGPLVSYTGGVFPRPHTTVLKRSKSRIVAEADGLNEKITATSGYDDVIREAKGDPPIGHMKGEQAARDRGIPTIVTSSGHYKLDDKTGKPVWCARTACSHCGWFKIENSFQAAIDAVPVRCEKNPPHPQCPLTVVHRRRRNGY